MSEYKDALKGAMKALTMFANAVKPYVDWFDEHKENIFLILNGVADFANWNSAIQKLAANQIIFTDGLSFELANRINESENVDEIIKSYYFENNYEKLNSLIHRCLENCLLKEYGSFLSEVMNSYNNEDYQITCLGLLAIIDGLLTDISKSTITNYKDRIKSITDKIDKKVEISQIDRKLLCVYLSISTRELFNDSILGNSNLNDKEPDLLNRHWLLHGRTHKSYDKYDCLKAFLWIESLIILYESTEKLENGNE